VVVPGGSGVGRQEHSDGHGYLETEKVEQFASFRFDVSAQIFETQQVESGGLLLSQLPQQRNVLVRLATEKVDIAARRLATPRQVDPGRHDPARIAHQIDDFQRVAEMLHQLSALSQTHAHHFHQLHGKVGAHASHVLRMVAQRVAVVARLPHASIARHECLRRRCAFPADVLQVIAVKLAVEDVPHQSHCRLTSTEKF